MTTPTNTRAAGFVAKAMGATHPSRRRALLTDMLGHVVAGLTVILGQQGCSELLYAKADEVATRASAGNVGQVTGRAA